jgi:hypothetical protein
VADEAVRCWKGKERKGKKRETRGRGQETLASWQALHGRNTLLVDETNKIGGHSVSHKDRSQFSHCGGRGRQRITHRGGQHGGEDELTIFCSPS